MRRGVRHFGRSIAAALLLPLIAFASPASATPVVTYTATALASGYEYDLTIDNTKGTDAISGLLLLHAARFMLDASSVIKAPTGWMDIVTSKPLFFMAEDASDDVQAGASLGGFIFDSEVRPDTIDSDDFKLVGISERTADETDPIDPKPVPEPNMLWIIAAAGFVVAVVRRGHSGLARADDARSAIAA